MRIIVSNVLEDKFRNYKVFKSIKDLLGEDLAKVQCVVLHHSDDTDFNAGMGISKLHSEGVRNIFYVCENPSPTITMTVQGVGGVCVSDEFYLDDEEELDALLEECGFSEENTSLSQSSILIIKEFMQAFARKEERINAPFFLEQVNAAVSELSALTQQQELQIKDMGNSAVSIFEHINKLVSSMSVKQQELTKQLNTLLDEQSSSSSSPRNRFGSGGVLYFPSFKYMGSAKVLAVRELSPCRYLTSFMLAYHHHLTYNRNKRAKLIFVHQKGEGVSRKYDNFTTITQESIYNDGLYASPVIATNNPKGEVMRKLTSCGDNIIIVVDRLYGGQPIITTKVVPINAVGGLSDLARFKVKPKDCIFSIANHPNGLFAISHLKNYPQDVDSRYALYANAFEKNFEILDKMLEV